VVTAELGGIAAGDTATVTITVDVDADLFGMILNTATVEGSETDTNTSNDTDEVETEVMPLVSSIAGFVYLDADDDGEFDVEESAIEGVTIRLSGTDFEGNAVNEVQTTDSNGAYAFTDLMPGMYEVRETQPHLLRDGRDTQGTLNLGQVRNDVFAEMDLPGGVDAENYNFGEGEAIVTKLWYLASTDVPYRIVENT
jgi:hypothetical protein